MSVGLTGRHIDLLGLEAVDHPVYVIGGELHGVGVTILSRRQQQFSLYNKTLGGVKVRTKLQGCHAWI